MKVVVPYSQAEEYDFVNGLCILFEEVDINGDGTMEWDEFASFIIEAVDTNHMKNYMNQNDNVVNSAGGMAVAEHLMSLEARRPKYLHETNMLQLAQAQCVHEFHQSNVFKDQIQRHNPIIKAILYRKTDTYLTLE